MGGMATETLAKVSKVLGPSAVDSVTGQGEITLAVSGTHWNYIVPTWMRGKYVEITSTGASTDLLFGTDSSMEVVYNQATGESSGTLTVHAKTGRKVVDGQTRGWIVPATATRWAAEASGAGFISVGVASGIIER